MRRALKFIGFASITLVLFLVVAGLAFYHLISIGEFRRFLVDEIEKNTALKVQLGVADLEIGWITGVAFRDLALSEGDAAEPAITAERVTGRVALMPLLKRQIIIYEIRLQRPAIQLQGDAEGRIPLIDKLLNLPFLKQQNEQFNLDLHSIQIRNGEIDYLDQRKAASLGKWRLRKADVDLSRVRGQRLSDFMKDLFKRQPSEPAGAALEFDLKSAVEKDQDRMNLKARGRLVFPEETIEFNQARWNADIELVDFPATLIKERVGAGMPIKSMTGHLAQRVHLEGNLEKQLQLKGDLEFKRLALEAPELFLAPLTDANGRTSFELEWTPQRLQVRRADFRANDIKFSLQGEIGALDSADPHLRLTLAALPTSLSALRRYMPLKLVESPQLAKTFNSNLTGQIEIKQARVDGRLTELRRTTQGGLGKQIQFDAELRDVAGSLGVDGMLPLRAIQGHVSLANGVLAIENLKGSYGDSRLSDVDGRYDMGASGGGKFDLQAQGDFNLAELREQLRSGLVSETTARVANSLEELSGRGKFDLVLKRGADEAIQFDGKMAVDNARLRYDVYTLSEIKGELAFTPREVKGEKIRAQIGGSPIQIQLSLKDYGADDGTFDVAIDSTGVKAGVITTLLLKTGTPQDLGLVNGAVRYAGSIKNKEQRKFTGNLDLTNVQVVLHPLLQPLRELNGKIVIDEKGIDFQNLKALLVGSPASASGRWRYGEAPQLLFDFAAPSLDVTYLISQIDPEVGTFYANLQAEGKITLAKGRIKNFEFSDLKTDATIDRRTWRLTNLTARSAGGSIVGVTTIVDRPGTLGVIADPKIQAVPVQSFLKWFDVTNTEMTGRVNLTGKLETVGKNDVERKQNLNGAFTLRIEDGTINRMRALVQILNLLDLSRWFTFQLPDLSKQGISFRAITGDFKVTKGIYLTENLLIDSNDLRMTGYGKIDVPKDELDFVVAVRPFAGIDSAINQIPILGWGIVAIKNSFMVASFNVKGKIDDPTITPAPLGTLSEMFWSVLGIPKNIVGLGESERKEEAKEPEKTPESK